MLQMVVRRLVVAIVLFVALAVSSWADIAPQGQYLGRNLASTHPFMPEPVGKYRTRMAWLTASMVVFENQSSWERGFFGVATPAMFREYLGREEAYFASLKGMERYRYLDAMVRDYAQIQIYTLQDRRMSMALGTIPAAIFADVATAVLAAGVTYVPPNIRQGLDALDSRYLADNLRARIAGGFDVKDLMLRYRGLVNDKLFADAAAQVARGVSASDAAQLLAQSIASSGIGTAISGQINSPFGMLDMLRTQLVMDVAAYNCACVLDITTNRTAQATIDFMGSSGDYRTQLAFLLAQQLAPPDWTLLNARRGAVLSGWLTSELRRIETMKRDEPIAYASYMRSLLVDLETLEKVQIDALQSGATFAFVEKTSLNVLFGAFATVSGGGFGMQVVATLANAGYGAFDAYSSVSDELKIRMQMAALRETLLDNIMPFANRCGCGSGVVVVVETVVKGAPPEAQ